MRAATTPRCRARLLTEDERFRSLLGQVHGRGGKESAELRALIDEHAALTAQALSSEGCQGPNCKALAEVGKLVKGGEKVRVRRRSRSPDALRSKWLAGLTMPEIPVEDDPRVQQRFEFYTENPVGRETFQQMLFRCGAHKDMIQSALVRHGLPADLIAVVFTESGCAPLARSPAGAEGLWQFIPEAARAYHLRIIPDQVDERHSPQKSTEAAIAFLSDMYAKLKSWDLVFAGYNCGPFGIMARLERVEGENVGFWELVDAGMLPDETANYAPTIQAIALILNNLQRLKFGAIQMRAPQMTDGPVGAAQHAAQPDRSSRSAQRGRASPPEPGHQGRQHPQRSELRGPGAEGQRLASARHAHRAPEERRRERSVRAPQLRLGAPALHERNGCGVREDARRSAATRPQEVNDGPF